MNTNQGPARQEAAGAKRRERELSPLDALKELRQAIVDAQRGSFTPSQRRVALAVAALTLGFQRRADHISVAQIGQASGLRDKSNTCRTLRQLEERGAVTVHKAGGRGKASWRSLNLAALKTVVTLTTLSACGNSGNSDCPRPPNSGNSAPKNSGNGDHLPLSCSDETTTPSVPSRLTATAGVLESVKANGNGDGHGSACTDHAGRRNETHIIVDPWAVRVFGKVLEGLWVLTPEDRQGLRRWATETRADRDRMLAAVEVLISGEARAALPVGKPGRIESLRSWTMKRVSAERLGSGAEHYAEAKRRWRAAEETLQGRDGRAAEGGAARIGDVLAAARSGVEEPGGVKGNRWRAAT
jgi:hypothetical protein